MHNQIEAVEIDVQAIEETVEVEAAPSRLSQLAQRGLTTIEYAIGLVAAATVALVLLRIFGDNSFFQMMFDWVVGLFKDIAVKHG